MEQFVLNIDSVKVILFFSIPANSHSLGGSLTLF